MRGLGGCQRDRQCRQTPTWTKLKKRFRPRPPYGQSHGDIIRGPMLHNLLSCQKVCNFLWSPPRQHLLIMLSGIGRPLGVGYQYSRHHQQCVPIVGITERTRHIMHCAAVNASEEEPRPHLFPELGSVVLVVGAERLALLLGAHESESRVWRSGSERMSVSNQPMLEPPSKGDRYATTANKWCPPDRVHQSSAYDSRTTVMSETKYSLSFPRVFKYY